MPGTQEAEPQSLRLTQLEARNFKCIEALNITPGNKTLIIFKGPNEAGKTTAMEGFMAAIGGKQLTPDVPITKGKDEGHVTVTLGGENGNQYEVTRQFRRGKSDILTVRDISGERPRQLKAGQTLLDGLFDDLTFDPLAFVEADKKQQVRMLMSAEGLLEQYDQAQAERATLYDDRKEVNREIKRLAALVESTPDPAPGKDLEEISDEALAGKMQEAQDHNANRNALQTAICNLGQALAEWDAEVRRLEAEIEQTRRAVSGGEESLAKRKAELEELGPPIDAEALQAKLSECSEHNELCANQKSHRERLGELGEQEENAQELSDEIAQVDASLVEKLNATSLFKDVPGLEIRDGGIWHNDLPLSQASGMRRLDISCLVGMAANKTLRVMLVDEGDKLDDDSLTRLCDLADQHSYQILMTAVRLGDPSDPDTYVCELREGSMV